MLHLSLNAKAAAKQSRLWKNLACGDSFSRLQKQKFMNVLQKSDIVLIESLLHDTMEHLKYKCLYVKDGQNGEEPLCFDAGQVAEYMRLNDKGTAQKEKSLHKETRTTTIVELARHCCSSLLTICSSPSSFHLVTVSSIYSNLVFMCHAISSHLFFPL